jgi:hypothetical protein
LQSFLKSRLHSAQKVRFNVRDAEDCCEAEIVDGLAAGEIDEGGDVELYCGVNIMDHWSGAWLFYLVE